MALEQNYTRNESLTIGTSSTLISAKKSRKLIYIRNTSIAAQVVTIAFDNSQAAVSGTGIILSPGEYVTQASSEGFKCWDGDIKAISNLANATISVTEQPEVTE